MKRPFCVTILLWLVLSLTAWGGLRLWTAIQWWNGLQEFGTPPGALYIAVSGGAWLLAGLSLLWGGWRGKAWARIGLVGAAAGFSVWYWCDRLFFQAPRANWAFALGATAVLLVFTSVCACLPPVRIFFAKQSSKREANE
ncbi:MAG: hypothetical protein ACOYYU_21330 [Chloroflexota bacterium]